MGEVRFGGYRLDRLLGRGGMGQVWLAYDNAGARWVALKLLPTELAADASYRKRFEREAEVVSRLRDPRIPRIHRFGEIDGRLFIDMEFVEGADLAAMIAAGALGPATSVGIVAQVAAALDAAHRAGLVHRDVKPSNIVVHAGGFTYLIDFGIAHGIGQTAVTTTGLAIGTLAYMAPERFTGKADARSDVYSLACVLYECLTGARPYGDTDPAQQMHAHLMTDPPRAGARNSAVPAALDAVITRGMAKNPADRYPTAGDFAAAASAAIGIRRPLLPPPPTKSVRPPSQTKVLPNDGPPHPDPHGSSGVVGSPYPGPARGQRLSPTRVMPPAGAAAASADAEPAVGGASAGADRAKQLSPTRALPPTGAAASSFDGRPAGSGVAAGGAGVQRLSSTRVMPPAGAAAASVDAGSVVSDASAGDGGAKQLSPTKVMPEAGPTPTLVATRLAESVVSAPPQGYSQPGSRLPAAGASHSPAGKAGFGTGAPGTVVPHRPMPPRSLAAKLGLVRSEPRPVVSQYVPQAPQPPVVPSRYPVGYGRKVFPAPAKPPKDARRRPPAARPRRRKRGFVSKVVGALVIVFLTPFMLAAGCVALLAAGNRAADSGGSTAAPPPPTAVAEENPGPPPEQPGPVGPAAAGTAVRDGKFEFVVSDVDTGVRRVGLQQAAGSFLVVTLAVRNISDEAKWFLPFGQRLFDAAGTAFDPNATATMWQVAQHSYNYSFELAPGQSATTQLVFDVPAESTPTHLELHDFVLSNGVAVRLS
ncbi:serine/threonine-protein kinase [Nocardia brasiliensis]|uniref:serine/threonine-protein kinase n=1 Tax=Nocardia brasiliensis TaxID=37326 RepID=UPI002456BBFE|nr:serine/threonine-protein kinase [Nocardia brasiliensis]